MNKYYYKHLSQWEKRKLESLICNKPILKPIFGTTDHGWNIVNWKWSNVAKSEQNLTKFQKIYMYT